MMKNFATALVLPDNLQDSQSITTHILNNEDLKSICFPEWMYCALCLQQYNVNFMPIKKQIYMCIRAVTH